LYFKFEFESKLFEFIEDFKNRKLNPIRVKGFVQFQLNPVNPLTQLSQPEIWDKANTARDKHFALLWLNPAYPTVT
jgi:hypothetical protein